MPRIPIASGWHLVGIDHRGGSGTVFGPLGLFLNQNLANLLAVGGHVWAISSSKIVPGGNGN